MSDRRAFACDFDGTLYHHDAQDAISGKDLDAILAFQEAGGLFGVSTGRSPRAVTLQVGSRPSLDFISAVGGALVMDGRGGVICECRLPFDAVAYLHGTYAQRSRGIVIAAGRDLYTVGHRNHYLIRDVATLAELPSVIYGLSISFASRDEAIKAVREVNAAMGDTVNAVVNVTGVDVVAAGCTRDAALRRVRDALDVDVMAAMGDADNDLALLAAADVAYAPSDASPGMRAAADVVVPDVAGALAHFASLC